MGWLEDALRLLVGTPEGMDDLQYGIPMPGAGALGGLTRSGRMAVDAGRPARAFTPPAARSGQRVGGGRASEAVSNLAQRGSRARMPSPRSQAAAGGTVLGGGITAAGMKSSGGGVQAQGLSPFGRDPNTQEIRRLGEADSTGAVTGGDRWAERRRLQKERRDGGMDVRYSEGAHQTPQQAQYPGQSYGLDPQGNPLPGGQHGGGQGMGDFQWEDPYAEFLDSHYNQLAGAYDSQIDAVAGLGGVSRDLAGESLEQIGGFWDYAGNVAREGIPVTEDIYDTATSNVNQIRDDVGGRLEGMPSTVTDLATSAAGGGVSNTVAERTAAATAPFLAANESGRAAAVSNLASHSAAGQNYLNQLAGATGGEGAIHQTHVQGALDQQLQQIAFRQAELEGAKQRALSDISADIAGHSAERMGNAALAHALGLDLPGEGAVDPMQYLQAQGMLGELAGAGSGGAESMTPKQQVDLQRAMINLQSDSLNLEQQMNPNYEFDQVTSQMSPSGQQAFDTVRQAAESNFNPDQGNPRDIGFTMLQLLDQMASGEELPEESPLRPFLERNRVNPETMQPGFEDEVREGIRRLYGLG